MRYNLDPILTILTIIMHRGRKIACSRSNCTSLGMKILSPAGEESGHTLFTRRWQYFRPKFRVHCAFGWTQYHNVNDWQTGERRLASAM